MLLNASLSASATALEDRREALASDFAASIGRRGAIIEIDSLANDPQVMVDKDDVLLEEALNGFGRAHSSQSFSLRIWRNQRVLVVPRSLKQRQQFASAVRRCKNPVVLRRSGGSAVFHGPHVMNISMTLPPKPISAFSIVDCFEQIGSVILPPLRRIGLNAKLSDAVAAHCPGKFSIVLNERKLGGTAAFTRRTDAGIAAVVHASISLWPVSQDLAEIQAFDQALGLGSNYAQGAHISLEEALEPERW